MKKLGFSQVIPTIVNVLKQEGDITNKVDRQNIYPLIKSSDFPIPSISVTRVGWLGTYAKSHLAYTTKHEELIAENVTVQICVFSKTYDESNAVAEAVINTLDGREIEYNGVKVHSIKLESTSETVIGADLSTFQQTLVFNCIFYPNNL